MIEPQGRKRAERFASPSSRRPSGGTVPRKGDEARLDIEALSALVGEERRSGARGL
jgi:hypothetical protein